METSETTRSIATSLVRGLTFQEKAKLITSHVIIKSLQVYKDGLSMDSTVYNYGDIDRELQKFQEIENHLAAQLNAQRFRKYTEMEHIQLTQLMNTVGVGGIDNEEKLSSSSRRSASGVKVREGQQSIHDDNWSTSSCGLNWRYQHSGVDDDIDNVVVSEMGKKPELLMDSALNWQRPFLRQISNVQIHQNNAAFELGRGRHFKSVPHPRKKLVKTQSSLELPTTNIYMSLDGKNKSATNEVKTAGDVASTHWPDTNTDLSLFKGNEKSVFDDNTSFINDCRDPNDSQTAQNRETQHTTKSENYGHQNHDLYRTTISFAKLFQGIEYGSKTNYPVTSKDTQTTDSCVRPKDLSEKHAILHKENDHETNSLFVSSDALPRRRLQTAPTSSFYQREKISRCASFSRGHSLSNKNECLKSLQSALEIWGVETDISNQGGVEKCTTGESCKINKNDSEGSLFPKSKKISSNFSFDDSVLKIWGIDKALKCWEKKTESARSIARDQKTSNCERQQRCLRRGRTSNETSHNPEDISGVRASSARNSVDQTTLTIGHTVGEMKASNIDEKTRHTEIRVENRVLRDNFSVKMLALVKKWKEISKDGGNLANSTAENCLNPYIYQLKPANEDSEANWRVLNTKALILNSYLKEVKAQLNSLIVLGQMITTKDISDVAQTANKHLFKESAKKQSLEKYSDCTLERASAPSPARTAPKYFKTSSSDSHILAKASQEQASAVYSYASSLDMQAQFRIIHNTQSEYLYNSSSPMKCYASLENHDYKDTNKLHNSLDEQRFQSKEEPKRRKSSDFSTIRIARRLSKYLLGVSPTSDDVFFASKSSMNLHADSSQGHTTKAAQKTNVKNAAVSNFDKLNFYKSPSFEKSFDEGFFNAISKHPFESKVMGEHMVLDPKSLTQTPLNTSFTASEDMGGDDGAQSNNDDTPQLHSVLRASPEGQSCESIETINSDTENTEKSKSPEQIAAACQVISAPFSETDHHNKIQHTMRSTEVEIDLRGKKDASPKHRIYSRQNSARQIPYIRHRRINFSGLKERLSGLHKMPAWATTGNDCRSKANDVGRKHELSAPENPSWRQGFKFPSRSILVGSVIQGAGKLLPRHTGKQLESSLAGIWVPGVLSCAQAIIGGNSCATIAVSSLPANQDVGRKNSRLSVSKIQSIGESSPDMQRPRPSHPRIDELKKGEDHNKLCRKYSWPRVKPTFAQNGNYFRGYSALERCAHSHPIKSISFGSSPQIQRVRPVKCEENPHNIKTVQPLSKVQPLQSVSTVDFPYKQCVQPESIDESANIPFQQMPHEASSEPQIEELQFQNFQPISREESVELSIHEVVTSAQISSIVCEVSESHALHVEVIADAQVQNEAPKEDAQTPTLQVGLTRSQDAVQPVTESIAQVMVETGGQTEANSQYKLAQTTSAFQEQVPRDGLEFQTKLTMLTEAGRQVSKEPQQLQLLHQQSQLQTNEFRSQSSGVMPKLLRDELQKSRIPHAAVHECNPMSGYSTRPSSCPSVLVEAMPTSQQALGHRKESSEQTKPPRHEGRRRSRDSSSNTPSDLFLACCLPCLK